MEPVFNVIQSMRHGEQPGFTPVRRCDRPPQNASPEISTSAPWTTSRCNRLLRPLSSRIALLRRHREHKQLQPGSAEAAASGIVSKPPRTADDISCDAPQVFPQQPNKQDDPEWTPDYEPRKKLKRTYSARGGSQKSTQLEFGQGQGILIRPTQFRIQVPLVDQHIIQSCRLLEGEQSSRAGAYFRRGVSATDREDTLEEVARPIGQAKPARTRESFRQLAKSHSDQWMLDCGIYTGLEALLKATAKHSPQPVTGARSLFATCLRKVPEYIAEEQRWVGEEDEDEVTDISSVIYRELESLSSGESAGWKPLREIVRAHGIAIIGGAIKDGTVRPGTARGLVISCMEHDEADTLIDCWLSTLRPLAKPVRSTDDLFETSLCMRTLWDITGHDRWRFLHRRLSQLLLHGIVPVEWMCSQKMISCWNEALRSITRQDESAAEAAELIRTVISLSYQSGTTPRSSQVHMHRLLSREGHSSFKRQNSNSMTVQMLSDDRRSSSKDLITQERAKMSVEFTGTLSKIMAILLSINAMYSEEEGALAAGRFHFVQELLLTLAVEAHQLETIAPGSAHATRICLPLMAYILSSAQRPVDALHDQLCITFLNCIGRVDSKSLEMGILASFLCAVAHCSERNGGKTEFEYIQSIVETLLQLSQHSGCNRSALRSINTLIMDAAFDFAEKTSRQEHLNWALEVEETVEMELAATNSQQQNATPARLTQRKCSGFRWEEGISEWVARTPAPFAVLIVRPEQSSGESSTSDDEDDKIDVSTLPSELDDLSMLSQPPRRPRGRPPGTKDVQCGHSLPNKLAAKPLTRAGKSLDNAQGGIDKPNTHKRSRGRPPGRRQYLEDVTNCIYPSKENSECTGFSHMAKRLRGRVAQPPERRTSGRKRKRSGWGADNVSEDELGM